MLLRLIHKVTTIVQTIFKPPFKPELALAATHINNGYVKPISVRDIFDGLALVQKHKRPVRVKWRRRYGSDNWVHGIKMIKASRNLVACLECGHLHLFHTVCRNCFEKVNEESKHIIQEVRKAWKGQAVDKDTQILYKGESAPDEVEQKRIVELERVRPMWFAPNLSQRAADPSIDKTGDRTKESNQRIVQIKHDV